MLEEQLKVVILNKCNLDMIIDFFLWVPHLHTGTIVINNLKKHACAAKQDELNSQLYGKYMNGIDWISKQYHPYVYV